MKEYKDKKIGKKRDGELITTKPVKVERWADNLNNNLKRH